MEKIPVVFFGATASPSASAFGISGGDPQEAIRVGGGGVFRDAAGRTGGGGVEPAAPTGMGRCACELTASTSVAFLMLIAKFHGLLSKQIPTKIYKIFIITFELLYASNFL